MSIDRQIEQKMWVQGGHRPAGEGLGGLLAPNVINLISCQMSQSMVK